MRPIVSVLMTTCDRPGFIETAIKSVRAQSLQDWEIIIVDDSTGSATEEVVRPWTTNDPRVRYFHRDRKTNIAGASNFALSEAQGEYAAILDDDDFWLDGRKLEKQLSFLREHPEYVGCGGGYIAVDEQGAQRGRFLRPETNDDIRRNALVANAMANSTTMFRRDTALKLGGYDETLLQFADWDFWLKIGLAGKLYNAPEYFTAYRMWERGASFSKQKQSARSSWRIIWRYRRRYPGFLAALLTVLAFSAYAYLPAAVKRATFPALSRLRKTVFGRRA